MNKKTIFIFISLVLCLFIVFIFSLSAGSYDISVFESLKALFGYADSDSEMIVRSLRLPRILIAMIVGAGLSASGCAFQAILKNPLADPFTLGVSGGASLGAAIAFSFGFAAAAWFFVPLFAFCGALAAVFGVYLLSSRNGFDGNSMILSGIIISFVFSSAVIFLFALTSPNRMQAAFVWLMGGFSSIDDKLLIAAPAMIVLGCVVLCLSANLINLLAMGGQKAETLGINTKKSVKGIFFIASFITAACVCICGVIGFVGLMIPHIMRRIVGFKHSILMPACILGGAVFLPFCDALSRIIFSPVLFPVGVLTNLTGAVFFMALLLREKKTD
ncbi:MAG: iron ABC transporter permease [Elusimicrobiota bacterium]|jgi:iron complex transport system permease protein|nr:iron ABC transporter permease [Elusimicrobiota bacterium]